jgi:hypothetical protein
MTFLCTYGCFENFWVSHVYDNRIFFLCVIGLQDQYIASWARGSDQDGCLSIWSTIFTGYQVYYVLIRRRGQRCKVLTGSRSNCSRIQLILGISRSTDNSRLTSAVYLAQLCNIMTSKCTGAVLLRPVETWIGAAQNCQTGICSSPLCSTM